MMVEIPHSPSISYPLWIDSQLLQKPFHWLPGLGLAKRYVVITDHTVQHHYGHSLVAALHKMGEACTLFSFTPGEASKTYKTKMRLEKLMLKNQCDRETILLALGGGVVGDLTGFIAATYGRGIAYLQLPTSLLAMVDSSIGGKTGINRPEGKNLIGAFWQPMAVIADVDCLQTLPKTHLINGFIEAIKVFLTHDAQSVLYVRDHLSELLTYDPSFLKKIIETAVSIKAKVVQEDEKDTGVRMVLNFGHTVGHAIEYATRYKLLHGYAVALGILVESKISVLLGLLPKETYSLLCEIFFKLGIYGSTLKVIDLQAVSSSMRRDKKIKSGQIRYILLKKLGQVHEENHSITHGVPGEVFQKAWHAVSAE